MFQDDYIMRMIKAVADALASAIAKREEGEHEEAEESADSGLKLLLGPNYSFVGVLDGASLARLLPDTESKRLLARLLKEKASAAHKRGDTKESERLWHQARAVGHAG